MIKDLFKLFDKPSEFRSDPYGHVTNQLGHSWIGVAIPAWITWCIWFVTGDYPSQTIIAVSCINAYLFGWEIGVQKWRGFDSLEDTAFFALGASIHILLYMGNPVIIGGDVAFFQNWRTLDIICAFSFGIAVLLLPGVMKRIRQLKSAD